MRRRNPWIQKRKSLGDFDFSSTAGLMLMAYGFYCLFNWASDVFGSLRHR